MLIFNLKNLLFTSLLGYFCVFSVVPENKRFRLFGKWGFTKKNKKQKSMNVFDYSVSNTNKKGSLVLIGGAEDRKTDKVILRKVVALNNAKTAVIIPTASAYPVGLAEDYVRAFKDIGVPNLFTFDIRDKKETEKIEYLEQLMQADLIFFTGGDQFKLVNVFLDTFLFEKIKERYSQGVTIAGTSAGAAAACDPIIFDGDDRGLRKGTIHHSRGFGFIKNVTIDTHFVNRGRLGRLTQFLCSGLSTKGIGLGEDTAIVVSPDDIFEVIGSEMVTVVNTGETSYSNYNKINDNDPIVINDIKVGFLQSGSVFDLKNWKVVSSAVENTSDSRRIEACV
jgi:cyanophycinase